MVAQKNIQVLDSLRGLLAVIVALHHAALPFWGSGSALVKNAYLFVDFFFILSGFVMAHGYAGRLRENRQLGAFIALRFFRLWPLHIVTLSAVAACWVLLPWFGFAPMSGQEGGDAQSFAAMAFLTHAMGTVDTHPFNWPSWSIAAEFFVYILFALLCVVASGNRKVRLSGAVLFCALGIAGTVLIPPEFGPRFLLNNTQWGVLRALTGFFAGVLLREMLEGRRGFALRGQASCLEAMAFVAAVLGLVLLDTSTLWVWAMLPLFALLIGVFAFEQGRVSVWLRHPLLLVLGRLSFSIYLIHLGLAKFMSEFVFARIWHWAGPQPSILFAMPVVATFCAVLYLMLVTGMAAFTYHCIEMPVMGWARQRFRLPRPRAQDAAAPMPLSASTCCNSPAWNISRTMSQPPMNSPLT
jgi:peptidoglycan/LPS O-acetylase OafA/YrhL